MKFPIYSMKLPECFLKFPLVSVLPLLGSGCAQASLSLGLVFAWLWLCSGYLQSWSCCGCAQASCSLSLAFGGLWLCTGFPQLWSCLWLAVVVHWFSLVLVLFIIILTKNKKRRHSLSS